MKRLLTFLMMLLIPLAQAEAPPVMCFPEGHLCLASVPVGADEAHRLLAVAEPESNAVKLAIAARDEGGVYRIEALSGRILSLYAWDPGAV